MIPNEVSQETLTRHKLILRVLQRNQRLKRVKVSLKWKSEWDLPLLWGLPTLKLSLVMKACGKGAGYIKKDQGNRNRSKPLWKYMCNTGDTANQHGGKIFNASGKSIRFLFPNIDKLIQRDQCFMWKIVL